MTHILGASLVELVSDEVIPSPLPSRTSPAPPSPQASPLHRLRVLADGRCAVRAVMRAVGEAGDMATDNSFGARERVRSARSAAADALVAKMIDDDEFNNFVRWSFPDESFETFEQWLTAQKSDDTENAVSDLWHGGGSWTLYGLALHYRAKIVVHSVDLDSGALVGPPAGLELVDARETSSSAPQPVVRLASMRGADGEPSHFDILLETPCEGSVPLGLPYHQQATALASQRAALGSQGALLAWAALHLFALVVCFGGGFEGHSLIGVAQRAAAQTATLLLSSRGSPITMAQVEILPFAPINEAPHALGQPIAAY